MMKPMTATATLRAWLMHCLRMLTDSDTSHRHLLGPLVKKIRLTAEQSQAAVSQEADAYSYRRGKIEACNQIVRKLTVFCSDARAALIRRFRRENFGLEHQEKFGRNPRPKTTTDRAWLVIAADLVYGNLAAVAAGFDPMAQPSAEEIGALLEQANQACKEADEASLSYQLAQENLRGVNQ